MSNMSYYSRLKELHLESLEPRRLRTDLLTVYKILFGLLNTSTDVFITPVHAHFSCAGPAAWNSLPDRLKNSTLTIEQFGRLLKFFFFFSSY